MAKNSHIPDFTRNRSQIHYLDPPAGLFVSHIKHPFKCDFVPFDSRIQSKNALWKTSSLLPLPRQLRISISCSLAMSRGCLLVVIRDYYGSREFTIYEMRKGCFVWSVRCLVNTDDFMNPLLEGWLICSTVWSIVLGEREEDSCLVINLSGKVV
ncbi:hypothetical protein Tco_0747667 [Tanacetum coccineum]|uniref:Uncharacterized protein n=1 Tax=Tanacetum coccineum TaxID=301880 RepID=A0ABQ4YUC1_9ASTR